MLLGLLPNVVAEGAAGASGRKRATVVAAVIAYNLVQNLVVPRAGYVPANVIAGGGLVALARRYGCSWDDLGLDGARARSGMKLGMAGTVVTAGVTLAGALHPRARRYLLDQRAAAQTGRDIAYQALIRFPVGTALFEEVAFRGVVYGVWRREGSSDRVAALATGAVFGLWHLIPTARALAGNPAANQVASLPSRAGAVAAGAALTGVASLGLSWLRKASGSLIAPWLIHAGINCFGYLAGVAAWRRSSPKR